MTDTPALFYLSNDSFLADVGAVVESVKAGEWQPDYIVGIGRGGLVPAVYISHKLNVPMLSIDHSAKVPGFADELLGKVAQKSASGLRFLFVDDINDSGGTIGHIRRLLSGEGADQQGAAHETLRFAVLMNNCRSHQVVDYWGSMIDRETDKRWFVFPWEAVGAREDIVEDMLAVPERLA